MLGRFFVSIAVLFIAVSVFFYFYFNPSYQKSIEAEYYYKTSEYQKAYELSKEAYDIDKYNRMAFSIMTQSQKSLTYIRFINEASEYLDKIEKMSSKKSFDESDSIRVKMMCEVVLAKYKKLTSTKLTDKELIEKAKKINEKFENIYSQLFVEYGEDE